MSVANGHPLLFGYIHRPLKRMPEGFAKLHHAHVIKAFCIRLTILPSLGSSKMKKKEDLKPPRLDGIFLFPALYGFEVNDRLISHHSIQTK
jgi:hypothetical protein